MSARFLFACMLCSWLFVGCTFDDNRKHCDSERPCGSSSRCYEGFCIPKSQVTPRMDAAVSGGSGGSEAGADASTGAGGQGGSGGQPSVDTGVGGECQGDETRDCNAPWQEATALGGCGEGTQRCVDGEWGTCTPNRMMIGPEECNNLDDDCDGDTDEEADKACFPGGASGCTENAEGGFDCFAPCATGTQRCVGGNLQTCTGAMIAAARDNCSTEQTDENCDGAPNDGCACVGNETRDCYTGMPANTLGVGICRAGRQQCQNGVWSAVCQGVVVPRTETCNGLDDDCDGMTDDNPTGVGAPCTTTGRGICEAGTRQCPPDATELQCVQTIMPPGNAETCNNLDDNCDGMTDNVPASELQTNDMHCGMCGNACSGASSNCCSGMCVNPNTDSAHCGPSCTACPMGQMCMAGACVPTMAPDAGMMCGTGPACGTNQICCAGACVPNDTISNCGTCGNACAAGTVPACCSGACVDLSQNSNCGACGNVCPPPGGNTSCACATTGTTQTYACLIGSVACN